MHRNLMIYLPIVILLSFQSSYGNIEIDRNKTAVKEKDNFIIHSLDLYDTYYAESFDSIALGEKILLDLIEYSKSKKDYNGLLMSYYRLGKIEHVWKKDDVRAVKFFFESLKYAEIIGNKEYISKSYNYLGIIFYANHKYDDAIQYFQIAIKNRWKGEESFRSVPLYLSGLSYYELKQYDSAMRYFLFALDLVKKNTNSDREHEIEQGIAKVLVNKQEYKKAENLLAKSLNYYKTRNEPAAIAVAYTLYSKINYLENKLTQALDYGLKAYQYSNSKGSNDIAGNKIAIAQLLHDIYYKMGKIKEAHQYLLEVQELKDAATGLDITSQIALTYSKYRNEIERKQLNDTIVRQKENNKKAIIAAGVLGGLFLVIGFLSIFIRRERQKSEALIHNILPAKTVKQLKMYGKAIPQRHEAVTVMFCDVKEFTNLATSLEPEILINILDFYFAKFDSIVSNYNDIEKIKTIGDAYLCVSGLNNSPNHAWSLVSAAHDIIQFVTESHAVVKQKFGYAFEFRIGIHSGSIVSGVVGTHKYAYDIWGDTVNVAARMESSSSPGKINISQSTFNYIEPYFKCEKRGVIEVKNGLKLDMYFVLDKLNAT
ncbi:MAG: hypothetical protein JNL75_10095 [Chitinophagales bacterium]|nr:hypothetical protein [Chitinophagales bacterium]